MHTNSIFFTLSLFISVNSEIENNFLAAHDKRIVNGESIDITVANYYVYVQCGKSNCGGSLVKQNKVVTAGHCVDDCTASQFQIAVGLNDRTQFSQAKKYGASSIRLHPKYNKENPYPYDIAVITLSQNVALNNRVGTINFDRKIPRLFQSLTVVGYGLINTNGQRPSRLQRGQTRILRKDKTKIYTQALIGTSVLPGDSGGPAILKNKLAGIISGIQHISGNTILNIFVAVGHPEIYDFIDRNM